MYDITVGTEKIEVTQKPDPTSVHITNFTVTVSHTLGKFHGKATVTIGGFVESAEEITKKGIEQCRKLINVQMEA